MALRRPSCHRAAGRPGQGQSRRQAGGWYRCRTAPAHIPADPNKGTAARAARAQAPPPESWARPRPRPLAGGPRGPAPQVTCRPGRRRLPLGACYFFSSLFFSVNVLSFIVYEVAQQQAGIRVPLGRESGLFFSSIRSPRTDQRTPSRHFTL